MPAGMLLSDVSELYESAASVRYHQYPVRNSAFKAFSRARYGFFKRLGEAAYDPYWRDFNNWTYRFWRWAMGAPIPFNDPRIFTSADAGGYRKHLSACDQMYPGSQGSAVSLIDLMERLADSGTAPLFAQLQSLLLQSASDDWTALVLRETALFDVVSEVIDKNGLGHTVELVSPYHLKGKSYRRVVLVGPATWFPSHVFASPRARELNIIHYDWMDGEPKVEPIFLTASSLDRRKNKTSPRRSEQGDFELAADTAFTVHVRHYLGRVRAAEQAQGEYSEADARLFLLEGGAASFLDANSSALVIETDGAGGKALSRRPVAEIDPGMFLLLRQGSGGDYVAVVADSLLGSRAVEVRSAQKKWKDLLRNLVRAQGLQQVEEWLRANGGKRANGTNLRNWMSEGSIKTTDLEDFAAIMGAIGMKDQTLDYWRMMSVIDKAHIQAGQVIRRQLLKQVSGANAQALERVGRMDFTVNVANGVTMTAHRVLRVDPGTYKVPHSRLQRSFELEG